jgi:hypothetical protein
LKIAIARSGSCPSLFLGHFTVSRLDREATDLSHRHHGADQWP